MKLSGTERSAGNVRVIMRTSPVSKLALAALSAALTLSACTGSTSSKAAPTVGPGSSSASTTGPTATNGSSTSGGGGAGGRFPRFQTFDGCKSLLAYLQESALQRVGPYGFNTGFGYPMSSGGVMEGNLVSAATTAAPAAAVPASKNSAPSGAAFDSSGTNTQEAGVDEGDTVENDGRYVYAVVEGTKLHVVDTTNASKVASVDLPQGQQQIILDGKRLVVVTGGWGDMQVRAFGSMPYPGGNGGSASTISVFDVTDPTKPSMTSQSTLEGNALAVRSSGSTVRIVVRSGFGDRLPLLQPAVGGKAAEEKAKALNEQAIRDSKIEDWLPRSATGKPGSIGTPASAVECNQMGKPAEFAGLGLTWVASVDLKTDSPKVVGSAGVVAEGSTVYSSEKSLYVSTTRWQESPDPSVQPINPEPLKTAIHAFDFDGEMVTYKASGLVDGVLLNSYSMSERNGNLRVATTEQAGDFGSASSSSVRVLARQGDGLESIGSVTGLGVTEQIYAVRFIGDLGYVVTFRQTDPLYVIDLKDPTKPAVAGELKIPGFSSYLHPFGEGYLLGVGQSATDEGRTTGAQLSLFDVRDPSKPTQVATLPVGQGFTEAQYDPKAFLLWDKTGQVVVPVQGYGQPGQFTGAIVAQATTTSLTEQGQIKGLLQPGYEEQQRQYDEQCKQYPDNCYKPDFATPFTRSMIVNNKLVLVAYSGLEIVALDTLAPLGSVSFIP
jgi:Beta propeller domain